jgi:hypothetical protein
LAEELVNKNLERAMTTAFMMVLLLDKLVVGN